MSMDNTAHSATISNGIIPVKLTGRIVQQQPDWEQWEKLEFKHHDAYEAHRMCLDNQCHHPNITQMANNLT